MTMLRGIARNVDRSLGGVWWDYHACDRVDGPVEGHFCLLVAERDNPKHRAATAALALRHRDDLRAGGEKAEVASRKIVAGALAEGVVLDWSGAVDLDGKAVPYSKAECASVFEKPENWPVLHFVQDVAALPTKYRQEQEERAAGN